MPVGLVKNPKLLRYVGGEAEALVLPAAKVASTAHNGASRARTGPREIATLLDITNPS
jgi:hypothetical protein